MAASGRRSPQSLRCSFCAKDWPLEDLFRTCPCCGRATWEAEGKPPAPDAEQSAEIDKARRAQAFAYYCRQRDLAPHAEALAELHADLARWESEGAQITERITELQKKVT